MNALAVAPGRRITDELLAASAGEWHAVVSSTVPGIVAGLDLLTTAMPEPQRTGRWLPLVGEGERVQARTPILEISGSALQIATAEDHVLGPLGFAGGVAIAASDLHAACPDGLRLSCGGWKKLPAALKPSLRAGLAVAGVTPRLIDGDFVYIAKTTIVMLGGPIAALRAGIALDHGPVSVQVTNAGDAVAVARAGAGIVMVDDGSLKTLRDTNDALRDAGLRNGLTLAFAGGVTAADLVEARGAGADVVDVGRAIIDAPLWDLHLEITP